MLNGQQVIGNRGQDTCSISVLQAGILYVGMGATSAPEMRWKHKQEIEKLPARCIACNAFRWQAAVLSPCLLSNLPPAAKAARCTAWQSVSESLHTC